MSNSINFRSARAPIPFHVMSNQGLPKGPEEKTMRFPQDYFFQIKRITDAKLTLFDMEDLTLRCKKLTLQKATQLISSRRTPEGMFESQEFRSRCRTGSAIYLYLVEDLNRMGVVGAITIEKVYRLMKSHFQRLNTLERDLNLLRFGAFSSVTSELHMRKILNFLDGSFNVNIDRVTEVKFLSEEVRVEMALQKQFCTYRKRLRLSERNLTLIPPELCFYFANITLLDISRNSFSKFPHRLSEFPQLQLVIHDRSVKCPKNLARKMHRTFFVQYPVPQIAPLNADVFRFLTPYLCTLSNTQNTSGLLYPSSVVLKTFLLCIQRKCKETLSIGYELNFLSCIQAKIKELRSLQAFCPNPHKILTSPEGLALIERCQHTKDPSFVDNAMNLCAYIRKKLKEHGYLGTITLYDLYMLIKEDFNTIDSAIENINIVRCGNRIERFSPVFKLECLHVFARGKEVHFSKIKTVQKLAREFLSQLRDENYEVLDFRYCGLTVLPEVLFPYFQRVRVLKLRFNSLENLPDSLTSLQNLEDLDLYTNKFQGLPRVCLACSSLRFVTYSSKNPQRIETYKTLEHDQV